MLLFDAGSLSASTAVGAPGPWSFGRVVGSGGVVLCAISALPLLVCVSERPFDADAAPVPRPRPSGLDVSLLRHATSVVPEL